MIPVLMATTVASLTAACVLVGVVWRLWRHERRRSDARVAALAAMAGRHDEPSSLPMGPRPIRAGERAAGIAAPVHPRVQPQERGSDLPLRDGTVAASSAELFVEPTRESPWGRRIAVMTGIALGITALVLLALASRDRAAVKVAIQAPAARQAARQALSEPGLELLSLRDSREDGKLTIAGTVRNPRSGGPLSHVVVTAFVFDASGRFLASGRAPLDYTALAPGDESPFFVTVQPAEGVARYRVGFRGEDGRVIAHVDRRGQGVAIAENR